MLEDQVISKKRLKNKKCKCIVRNIEGRMEGKRGRGKPRIMMLDDIKADET